MGEIRAFGIMCIVVSIGWFVMIALNLRTAALGGNNLMPTAPFALLSGLVGLGLLRNRKWAAVLLFLCLSTMGLWLGVGSLFAVPFPLCLINVAFACVLLVPCVVIVRGWCHLD